VSWDAPGNENLERSGYHWNILDGVG